MTDKQIIDGVDVGGCLFYQINFEEDYDVKIKHYCSKWHNSCESNNNFNCYYKNWQRAERKLEKIKKVCNKFIPDHFKILLIINGGIIEGKENE